MSEPAQPPREPWWRRTRRRAGCLAGCLTEPLVILGLVVGGLVAGWLWKRKGHSAPESPTAEDVHRHG